MIASVLLAAQLAAAGPGPRPDAIVAKDAQRSVRVALAPSAAGPMLRPAALAPILEVVVVRRSAEEWTVRLDGALLVVRPGSRFLRQADTLIQLTAAPAVLRGELYVPLQFLADVVPAVRGGLIWDPARRELRKFSPTRTNTVARAGEASAEPRRAPAASPGADVRPAAPIARRPGAQRRRVVVDAGHGGPDRGMSGPIGAGPRIFEKDITLQVARRVGARLEALGVDVVFTRQRDTLIALSDRGRIANDANGDLFISIHVNAANPNWKSPGAARGFETYFLAEAKTEDARRVERMENEAVQYETAAETAKGDPLGFIVADMLQNEHLRESSELAELIQRRLRATHPGPDRGVKQAGFRVLVTAFMPAVLVEIGFGTNPAEARYIASEAGQQELAEAVAAATVEYLARYERRVGGDARR